MPENAIVPPAEVSNKEGTPAPQDAGNQPAPQPSPEEQKITELVSKKVAEEMAKLTADTTKATEAAKRELQSAKDKARAEIEAAHRRARFAETTLDATKRKIDEIDPDTGKELELARYRAEEEARRQQELTESAQKQQAEFHEQFTSSLRETISDMGIDPEDKRIDWATDASNYLDAQKRVLRSAAKIKRESEIALQESVKKQLKETEERIRRDLGVNSVDTSGGSGVSSDGIPTDLTKFRDWIATIPQVEYETKYADKVKELMRQDKIK